MARQLAFDLPVRTSLARGNFFVSDANAAALARLDAGEPGPFLLTGPPGAGKTHLVHVWAARTGATVVATDTLAGADVPSLASRALAVEDAGRLPRAAEEPLLHLFNLCRAGGVPLLLTAEHPAARWDIALPDLESRLLATETLRIEPPDEALLAAVLVKLFADRQLDVAPATIAFLVARMERSLTEASRLVAALDAAALAAGRPVTRSLAREVMDLGAGPGDSHPGVT